MKNMKLKLRLKLKNYDGLSPIKNFFKVISLNFCLRIYEYQRHLIYWYLTFYIDLQSLVVHSKSVIIFSIMYFYSTIHKHFINNKRTRPSKLYLETTSVEYCTTKPFILFDIHFSSGSYHGTSWFSPYRSQHLHKL